MVTCNAWNTREYRQGFSRTKLRMIHYTAGIGPLFNLQAKKILWYDFSRNKFIRIFGDIALKISFVCSLISPYGSLHMDLTKRLTIPGKTMSNLAVQ